LDCLDTINLIWYNNLCWMVHLFFGVWLLIEIFFNSWFMFEFGVCLLLSRFWIINNLFLNWYLVWFKTYYCVSPNMVLVKLSKVRWQFCNQFWFFHFCFHHFIFNIWNCDLHMRRFFNIKRIGSLSQKKTTKKSFLQKFNFYFNLYMAKTLKNKLYLHILSY
jgi:hypothetical protein